METSAPNHKLQPEASNGKDEPKGAPLKETNNDAVDHALIEDSEIPKGDIPEEGDTFVSQATQDIQPLPNVQPPPRSAERVPGAYAVNTMPRFAPALQPMAPDDAPQIAEEIQAAEEGMAVATAVDPDHGMGLQQACPDESPDQGGTKGMFPACCNLQLLVGLGAVFMGLIVVVVSVVTSIGNRTDGEGLNTNEETDIPTMAPTSNISFRELILQTILPPTTWEVATQDPNFPQALAYEWILEDPSFLSQDPNRILQRYALATLFYATSGELWVVNDHWLNYSVHECAWYSNSADGQQQVQNFSTFVQEDQCQDGEYRHLWLYSNNLKGAIPKELYLLSTLQSLNLRSNADLTGRIDTEIETLTQLEVFNLGATGVSGSLPTQLGKLSGNLKSIELPMTKIEGTLPTQLGKLTKLETLSVTFSALEASSAVTGTLPEELGNLTCLRTLVLNFNQLSGTIPTQLSKLTQLERFQLDYNAFTGTIPSQLGQLTNTRLFNHHFNKLRGSIPSEIGLLTNCVSVMLAGNALNGTIPSELGLMTSLNVLHLWLNYLSGTIPSTIGMLSNLGYMYLEANMLSGQLPTEIGQLKELVDFWILHNQLSSSVPSEFGLLSSLFMLELSVNNLSGSLPSQLGQMPVIEHLNLAKNQLTGPIPSELGQAQTLNKFSTFIPTLAGGPYTVFSDNSASYDYIVQNFLDLSNNNLSGTIPSEVQLLWDMGTLNLVNNSLITGIVPEDLCGIENLQFDCSPVLCGCDCSCNYTETWTLTNATQGNHSFDDA